jgi:hypothetical protein
MSGNLSNRLEQLFAKLGYNQGNGLYYITDVDKWQHKFPYRISRVLKDVIKPYAFFCALSETQDYAYKFSEFTLQQLQKLEIPSSILGRLNILLNNNFKNIEELEERLLAETFTKKKISNWMRTVFQNLEVVHLHPTPLNSPFILFFNKPDKELFSQIPKLTFSFGQAPIIVINKGDYDDLEFYHGYDFDGTQRDWLKSIEVDELDFHISKYATGKTWKKYYDEYFKNVPKVDKRLLNNIIDARRILIAKDAGNLAPKYANRLIGRLLFVRYLIDRDVSFEKYIAGKTKVDRQKSFLELLNNHSKLYDFLEYLSEKYNGDLFPVKERDENRKWIFEKDIVTPENVEVLYHLFNCSDFFKSGSSKNGYIVQPSFFDLYDFNVIPVELISNIYENFIGETDTAKEENKTVNLATKQKEIKAYYTPTFLVDYVLSQSVVPYLQQHNKAKCKILDPACGSGIFLVESLRKLIEKELQLNPQFDKNGEPHINNDRLWEIVRNNIFGIDIDEDAIEITILSLYITILDYKTRVEIENFRFKPLKNNNLFGGADADFFNLKHEFNTKFKQPEYELDFIIGNPPWGKVTKSDYFNYIAERNKREKAELEKSIKKELEKDETIDKKDLKKAIDKIIKEKHLELSIGEGEISQAFIVRTSDFIKPDKRKGCVLVVKGNNLYNTNSTAKNWRKYFLNEFHLHQVLELTSISNKITSGNQIFENAKQSGVVLSYTPAEKNEDTSENLIRHIATKANRFFNTYKVLTIQRQDVKIVKQSYFTENDWLWKVLLHGNSLDYFFIRRLDSFTSFKSYYKKFNLVKKGGLKAIDGTNRPQEKRKSTKEIFDWDYLETDQKSKNFKQYQINPTKTWNVKAEELTKLSKEQNRVKIYENSEVGYLPDLYFFKGSKLLFKKGAEASDNFKIVTAFSEQPIVFSSTVFSVKTQKGVEHSSKHSLLLKTLVGLFNSKITTYFMLLTSSSIGVDRTRVNFEDLYSFPVIPDQQIADITDKIQETYKKINSSEFNDSEKQRLEKEIPKYEEQILMRIYKIYKISDEEQALIDYAIDIAIPVLKREEEKQSGRVDNIFAPLRKVYPKDIEYLTTYAEIFIKHFSKKYDRAGKYFMVEFHITSDFIGCKFIIADTDKKPDNRIVFIHDAKDEAEMMNRVGSLGIHNLTSEMYIQQDIRGFNKNSFYVIKPNERKLWHKAVAYTDRAEFIDKIVEAEIHRKN